MDSLTSPLINIGVNVDSFSLSSVSFNSLNTSVENGGLIEITLGESKRLNVDTTTFTSCDCSQTTSGLMYCAVNGNPATLTMKAIVFTLCTADHYIYISCSDGTAFLLSPSSDFSGTISSTSTHSDTHYIVVESYRLT